MYLKLDLYRVSSLFRLRVFLAISGVFPLWSSHFGVFEVPLLWAAWGYHGSRWLPFSEVLLMNAQGFGHPRGSFSPDCVPGVPLLYAVGGPGFPPTLVIETALGPPS